MNPIATVWVGIITIIFILPFSPAGVPGNEDFSWSSVNYAPIVTGVVLIGLDRLVVRERAQLVQGPEAHDLRAGRGSGPCLTS